MSSTYKSFLGLVCLVPIALVSAAACGGNAFENRTGVAGGNGLAGSGSLGSGGSSVGSGGSSVGSGGSSAGTGHSVGGQSSGEAGAATGGGLGRGGAGGAGSGSGGSGGIDVTACTSNTQCEIVHAGCCSCGNIGPAEDFTAINSAYRAQFNTRCSTVDCGGCPPMRAPLPSDPYFSLAATCQRPIDAAPNTAGHCAIVDLRQTEITACETPSDCTLRAGTACCSGCSGVPVAINGSQNAALSALVCGTEEPIACPACAPNFTEYTTGCHNGLCTVEVLLD
ncbi:MAG TPA: hypothetical protein VER96_29550 [Polyangiaceae bacterium]|nr:hypothetical protein [Polyangiaceae bacterium]